MSDDLQFDEAQYDAKPELPTHCGSCNGPLGDPFWVQDGRTILCNSCKIERAEKGGGLNITGILLGGVAGTVAAFGAGALWGLITYATSMNIGLIAIAAGAAVAIGIRMGSGRGGLIYQLMAAVLTYLSIVVAMSVVELMYINAEGASGGELAIAALIAIPVVTVQLIPSSIENGQIISLFIYAFAIYQAVQMSGSDGTEGFEGPYTANA